MRQIGNGTGRKVYHPGRILPWKVFTITPGIRRSSRKTVLDQRSNVVVEGSLSVSGHRPSDPPPQFFSFLFPDRMFSTSRWFCFTTASLPNCCKKRVHLGVPFTIFFLPFPCALLSPLQSLLVFPPHSFSHSCVLCLSSPPFALYVHYSPWGSPC